MKKKAKVFNCLQMGINMKEHELMGWWMDMADINLVMVTYLRDCFRIIKDKELEFIIFKMASRRKAFGIIINLCR